MNTTTDKWCVYITRHRTGKFYGGKGVTEAVQNGTYKGSGVMLHKYFKKYPATEWISEILSTHDIENDAYAAEANFVTEEMLLNPDCLNLIPGGHGWTSEQVIKHNIEMWKNPLFVDKMRKMKAAHWLDPQFVERITKAASEFQTKRWQDPEYRKFMTEVSNRTVNRTWRNPEFQAEMSRRAWAKPEVREFQRRKTTERWVSGPLREQQRIGAQKVWEDPVKSAQMRVQRSNRMKNIRWMNKDGVARQIPINLIAQFEADGWNGGMKCKS